MRWSCNNRRWIKTTVLPVENGDDIETSSIDIDYGSNPPQTQSWIKLLGVPKLPNLTNFFLIENLNEIVPKSRSQWGLGQEPHWESRTSSRTSSKVKNLIKNLIKNQDLGQDLIEILIENLNLLPKTSLRSFRKGNRTGQAVVTAVFNSIQEWDPVCRIKFICSSLQPATQYFTPVPVYFWKKSFERIWSALHARITSRNV